MNQLRRIGLLGRIVLILMTALAVVIVVTLATIHWHAGRSPYDTYHPRLRQVAGIVDLMRDSPTDRYPAILRAAKRERLRVRIVARVPASPDLVVAPQLTARLRSFARTGSDMVAYTDPHETRSDRVRNVEGYLIRATWPMPGGRMLLFDNIPNDRHDDPDLFGIPSALWIGGAGVLIAAVDAMQRRVAQLVAERTLTIGAISHDLRTLLTRLHLRAATLTDGATRERIETDLGAMQALVDDALAFARHTHGVRSPARRSRRSGRQRAGRARRAGAGADGQDRSRRRAGVGGHRRAAPGGRQSDRECGQVHPIDHPYRDRSARRSMPPDRRR